MTIWGIALFKLHQSIEKSSKLSLFIGCYCFTGLAHVGSYWAKCGPRTKIHLWPLQIDYGINWFFFFTATDPQQWQACSFGQVTGAFKGARPQSTNFLTDGTDAGYPGWIFAESTILFSGMYQKIYTLTGLNPKIPRSPLGWSEHLYIYNILMCDINVLIHTAIRRLN